MKAIRFHRFGGPEVLRYEDVPMPEPDRGEVLIRVHAAGVSPLDWKFRGGHVRNLIPLELPAIPGWDISGTVEATGPVADGLNPGDEVYGHIDVLRGGADAEYVAIQDSTVALKPKSLDHVHAAAIPADALTAWQSLFEVAQLQAGQRLLIHGAVRGVGSIAVQLGKWKGAYVIATGSTCNWDFLKALGADEVLDCRMGKFEERLHGIDVVLDTVGWQMQERSWATLKQRGILVSIVAQPSLKEALARDVRGAFMFTQPDASQLDEIAKLVDAGHIKTDVETILPLSDAAEAHQLSQSRHLRGKIVLRPD